MMSIAFSNAFVPVGFGGPEKPTCASLSCTRLNGAGASPFLCRNQFRTPALAFIAGATEISAPAPSDIPEILRNSRRSMFPPLEELVRGFLHPPAGYWCRSASNERDRTGVVRGAGAAAARLAVSLCALADEGSE